MRTRLNTLKEYMTTENQKIDRETWLNKLAALFAPRFEELGYPLPKFHVSIGFPGSGKSGNAAAECWNAACSADGAYQIFIRPDEADSMVIAGHLAHELTHAAVGFEHGHKGAFADVVLAFGLLRPLTATRPGPAFKEYAAPFIEQLGTIPHPRLKLFSASGVRVKRGGAGKSLADLARELGDTEAPATTGKPKQGTRMLKCECKPQDGSECGYTVRLSKKWFDKHGAVCPVHGSMALSDAPELDD